MAKKLTSNKAKEILHDKSVHGHPLTDKQRRFFGAIAGGAPVKAKSGGWLDEYNNEVPQAQKGKQLPPIYTDDPRKIQAYQDSLNFYNYVNQMMKANQDRISGKNTRTSDYLTDKQFADYFRIKKQKGFNEISGSSIGTIGNKTIIGESFPKPVQPYILQQQTPDANVETYIDDQGVTHQTIGLIMPPRKGEKRPTLPKSKYKPESKKPSKGDLKIMPASGQRPVLGDIPTLPYRVDYFDPTLEGTTGGWKGQWSHESFPSEAEGSQFQKELQNRPGGIGPWGAPGYYEKPPKKENGGWLDNYPNAENGIEGTMGGLTDQGFNYNSAWGGQFAMGGSLPGSVGFTYARTRGIPSEGPYAKKTLPSAQNGQEMSYYQHGLDWKPRNISQIGSSIPFGKVSIINTIGLPQKFLQGAYNLVENLFGGDDDKPEIVEEVKAKTTVPRSTLLKQAFKESRFDPNAVSQKGYKGLTQIGEDVIQDYIKKTGRKNVNAFNPRDARDVQEQVMNDLYNSEFINKPGQSDDVRMAKTLAAYNWGRGNLSQFLNEKKKQGVDIYNSTDWIKDIPNQETQDYVNYILYNKDINKDWTSKAFEEAKSNPKYKNITSLYQKNGGVVKDNNGYWNPKNWGKVVEIDSNDITMKGVNQPLVGVSDEGHVQYMEPGKDYKFKGKKVTEYPLAKTGGWLNQYK